MGSKLLRPGISAREFNMYKAPLLQLLRWDLASSTIIFWISGLLYHSIYYFQSHLWHYEEGLFIILIIYYILPALAGALEWNAGRLSTHGDSGLTINISFSITSFLLLLLLLPILPSCVFFLTLRYLTIWWESSSYFTLGESLVSIYHLPRVYPSLAAFPSTFYLPSLSQRGIPPLLIPLLSFCEQ